MSELERESKSKRKREMIELQKIGESLTKLSEEKLLNLELPDNLRIAVLHAKTLTSHGAIRRQLQYIGKIMREIDAEQVEEVLTTIQLANEKNNAIFHQVEDWRAKLLKQQEEDALTAFLNDFPGADSQRLRHLIRKALLDKKNNKNSGAATELFKYIRFILEANQL